MITSALHSRLREMSKAPSLRFGQRSAWTPIRQAIITTSGWRFSRNFKGAIAAYRAAIQKTPWFYNDAHFNLAVALQAVGQRTEAVREFQEFLSHVPDTPSYASRITQAKAAIRKLK